MYKEKVKKYHDMKLTRKDFHASKKVFLYNSQMKLEVGKLRTKWEDYNSINESNILIFCDNSVVINLIKNHVLHSRVKHIEIKHHFIRNSVQNEVIDLKFVSIDDQLVDIFTKSSY